jgi:hypothetical protein
MIEIKFTFETLEESQTFLNNIAQISKPKIKKENDGRGKSTKQFHVKCKEFQEQNPDKTYKECLKAISELNKNIDL